MGKAGGIIGLIAGIFAVIAALVTLVVGGVGSAFEAKSAGLLVAFGWLGLASSFFVIVSGAVAIFKPSVGAFGLLFLSLVGAAVGGSFVAICLMLSLLGGILAAIGSKSSAGKRVFWPWTGLPLGVVVAVMLATQMAKPPASSEIAKAILPAAATPAIAPTPVVVQARPDAVPVALVESVSPTTAAPVPKDARENVAKAPLPQDVAAAEFEAADKALNAAYKETMSRLSTEAKTALRAEQRIWIKQRDEKCEPAASAGIGAGSAGELDAMGCRTTMTSKRTGEIQRL